MACSGFGIPPPNAPECRSRTGPVSVTSADASPRMPVHMDGTSAAHMLVSLTTITSQASRSRSRRSSSAKCSEPDSSSPSTISLIVTGGAAARDTARQAWMPREWKNTWPLSSEAPRPSSTPLRSAGSNGGLSHSSSGSTGCTSWCP